MAHRTLGLTPIVADGQQPQVTDLATAQRVLWQSGIGTENGRRRLPQEPVTILEQELQCSHDAATELVETLTASQILRYKRSIWEVCRGPDEPDDESYPPFAALRDSYIGRKNELRSAEAFVGISQHAKEIRKLIILSAQDDDPVMITGESGTGKSIVARLIHDLGDRKSEPFVRINCAALPEGVLESELFGHERGAFTSAMSQHRGCFERAGGGTLFLDEIGEMPISFQSKLLQVLEEGVYFRVGGEEELVSEARVIVATNKNLTSAVAKREFRQDLYFRICGIPLPVPPLRERRQDVEHLVAHYAAELGQKKGRPYRVSEDGWKELLSTSHAWPGNVRELQSVMRMAWRLARYELIKSEHVKVPQLEFIS